jgi:hypothetical protein
LAQGTVARVVYEEDIARVSSPSYHWTWERRSDRVVLHDAAGNRIAEHRLQPYVRVHPAPTRHTGRCTAFTVLGHCLTVTYDDVNDGGRITVTVRFHDDYYVLETVTYESVREEDVVALYYAYDDLTADARPNGLADYYVLPGANQAPEQYIFPAASFVNGRVSLGCFGMDAGTFLQQPFLPHYMMAVYSAARSAVGTAAPVPFSGAACLGLAGIPDGSVMVEIAGQRFSPCLNLRSDLWHHRSGPGALHFDAPWVVAVAETWYAAMHRYIEVLLAEGYAQSKAREAVPASAYWPQYDIWGDQVRRACGGTAFTQSHLETIYHDFRTSGMRARLFVIDDGWEQAPGALVHSVERFPTFDGLLARIRADGHEIGLWTAFARCRDYREFGLDAGAVLRTPQGNPYRHPSGWYIFDPTHPDVQRHLSERAAALVRRYGPKLIKLDFGYEIPPPDVAAPHELAYAGERLFQKFLEVLIPALRAADPEVTIQYYALTPLLAAYYDQYSCDDLWLARGSYHDAFNKRAVLATLCGAFGVVPYGSTGYDWASAPEIWFDTTIMGTIGSLAPFVGDENGEHASRAQIARYNGLAQLTRWTPHFTVEFLEAQLHYPMLGPRASSWVRMEPMGAVVVALRPGVGHGGHVETHYRDLLSTDCSLVAASLDERALADTTRIGLVTLGEGTVRLRRPRRRAAVVAHLDGGGEWAMPATMDGDEVVIPVTDWAPNGAAIEFVEVHLRPDE